VIEKIHKGSSYTILVAVAIIAIISIFDGSETFINMAQTMAFPSLIYSFVNLWVSIESDIIQRLKKEVESNLKLWRCQGSLIHQTKNRLEEMQSRTPGNYWLESIQKNLTDYESENKTTETIYLIFKKLSENSNKVMTFIYIASSVLVILSMALSDWLIELFPIIATMKLPVITFIALLISMGGIILKDYIVEHRFNKLVFKEIDNWQPTNVEEGIPKTPNEEKNNKTENNNEQ